MFSIKLLKPNYLDLLAKSFLLLPALLINSNAQAVTITDPAFFNSGDITIDFETLPGVIGTVANNTPLSSELSSLGVVFSSELNPNTLQTTDAADASGRFSEPFRILSSVSGGGAPTSGVRYASGDQYVRNSGRDVSDMRIDFTTPVSAVGMSIIDNDFSTARLQVFNAAGTLLETVVIPQVAEGGFAYYGVDVAGTGNNISYLILDGNNGQALDSTFIDDLSLRPVPVPAAAWLLVTGLIGLAGMARRRRH